ncbi:hypothetical protein HaLaN_33011, partial [Haematococcus lacustris]
MANKREFIAFLVDVGEFSPAACWLPMRLQLLHKPSHEIAVVLFGSDAACLYTCLPPASLAAHME